MPQAFQYYCTSKNVIDALGPLVGFMSHHLEYMCLFEKPNLFLTSCSSGFIDIMSLIKWTTVTFILQNVQIVKSCQIMKERTVYIVWGKLYFCLSCLMINCFWSSFDEYGKEQSHRSLRIFVDLRGPGPPVAILSSLDITVILYTLLLTVKYCHLASTILDSHGVITTVELSTIMSSHIDYIQTEDSKHWNSK